MQELGGLKRDDICIISNNCIGGTIAKDLKIRYNSPTVGLFFFSPDYITFLSQLDRFLAIEPVRAAYSRYGKFTYPIGLLDDIEIHFYHYDSFESAKAKWQERCSRIEGKRKFFLGSDKDHCTPDIIRQFDQLPYPNKLFFSSKPYPDLKSVVYFPEHKELKELPDITPDREWLKHVDVCAWLNNGI